MVAGTDKNISKFKIKWRIPKIKKHSSVNKQDPIRQMVCNQLGLILCTNSRCIDRFLHVRSHKHVRSFQMGQY